MPLDVVLWVVSAGMKQATAAVISRFARKDLPDKLRAAVVKWQEGLSADESLNPDALFSEANETPTAAQLALQVKILGNQIPTREEWHSALLDSREQVRRRIAVKDQQSFFRLPRERAAELFWPLAEQLTLVCAREPEFFGPTIWRELAHLREQLPEVVLAAVSRSIKDSIAPLSQDMKPEEIADAERRYRELALEACDIIDLAGLPEQDRFLAMRNIVLRQLFIPLRLRMSAADDSSPGDKSPSAYPDAPNPETLLLGSPQPARSQVSVGSILTEGARVMILGDPGGGKSTLLRWIATAYLLKLKRDSALTKFPDVETLPDVNLLPIIVRCRDLDKHALTGTLDDILARTLRKSEMDKRQSELLSALFRSRLEEGIAILLIDGLDEISDPSVRATFCKQIESISLAFPKSRLLVTSRIVGYREMGFRLGRGFVHSRIAELTNDDRDEFARRWCQLTEPGRAEEKTQELIRGIHASDRIERLTGNPMLLTTMALVKRKVGKLPNRRHELYWEAVQVLLNWRSDVDEPIDKDEALPQLEYVAYEMCRLGTKRTTEPELMELLAQVRNKYKNIRPIMNRSPREFLTALERRTSILIESGKTMRGGVEVGIFEFRHLTFQEYLAALAIVRGHYPGHSKKKKLRERVAPLAASAVSNAADAAGRVDFEVAENWREVLRLTTSICNDDDVDEVMLAIARPSKKEPPVAKRGRAILAGLALADEPHVDEATVTEVLRNLVDSIDERDTHGRGIPVALDLGGSTWAPAFLQRLIAAFVSSPDHLRIAYGSIYAMGVSAAAPPAAAAVSDGLAEQMQSEVDATACAGALSAMEAAHRYEIEVTPALRRALLGCIARGSVARLFAGSWACAWLTGWYKWRERPPRWVPDAEERAVVLEAAQRPDCIGHCRRLLTVMLGSLREPAALDALIRSTKDLLPETRDEGARGLGLLGSPEAVPVLRRLLTDQALLVRQTAFWALAQLVGSKLQQDMLTETPDPTQPISDEMGKELAKKLSTDEATLRSEYLKMREWMIGPNEPTKGKQPNHSAGAPGNRGTTS
jgi:hypothetical protein